MDIHFANRLKKAGIGKRTGINRFETDGARQLGDGLFCAILIGRDEDLQGRIGTRL